MPLSNFLSSSYNYITSFIYLKDEVEFKKPDAYKNINTSTISKK